MTETPTLDEQIAAMRRITARLEAGGVVMAYPDELPALNAILAKLEAHLAPLLADPVHPPSADGEREAQIRYGASLGYSSDADLRVLVRRLNAARLALSGAQADLTLRDAEIARLRDKISPDDMEACAEAAHEAWLAEKRNYGNGAPGRVASAIEAAEARGREQGKNPCDKIFSFKWLDPECVEGGCRSLTEFNRGAAQMRERAARLVDDHPDEEHPAIVDPEEIRGCCEVMAERIRSLPDRETGQ